MTWWEILIELAGGLLVGSALLVPIAVLTMFGEGCKK